jgi:RimJ/RimL family protein N-acetyltransferase
MTGVSPPPCDDDPREYSLAAGAHRSLGIPRIWLEINPGNEPSLRVARRAGYRFEQRLLRHCRDWACEDAEHDSWHDCLIWTHVSPGE